jgi:hypothetical protein
MKAEMNLKVQKVNREKVVPGFFGLPRQSSPKAVDNVGVICREGSKSKFQCF